MLKIVILLRQSDKEIMLKFKKIYAYLVHLQKKILRIQRNSCEQLQENYSNTKKYSTGVLLYINSWRNPLVIRVKSAFQFNDSRFSPNKDIAREKFDALNGIPNTSIFRWTLTRRIRNVKYHFPSICSNIVYFYCKIF